MGPKIDKYAQNVGFSVFLYQFESEIRLSSMSPGMKEFLTYPSQFENRFYDFRMNLTLDDKQKEDRLVLAAIDEATLKQLGRFPFSRIHWTAFIKKLKTFGAKTIAFDVIFSEPEIMHARRKRMMNGPAAHTGHFRDRDAHDGIAFRVLK